MPKKMPPTTKAKYDELIDTMSGTLLVFRHPDLVKSILPLEWRGIGTRPVPRTSKLTLRVDADVLRFFRKLGTGYQAQMNAVLRSFMLARLTEVLGATGEHEIAVGDDLSTHEREVEGHLLDMLERVRRWRLGLGIG